MADRETGGAEVVRSLRGSPANRPPLFLFAAFGESVLLVGILSDDTLNPLDSWVVGRAPPKLQWRWSLRAPAKLAESGKQSG